VPPALGLFLDPFGRPRPRLEDELVPVFVVALDATFLGFFLDILFLEPGGRPRLFGADLADLVAALAAAGLALFFEPLGRPLRLGAAGASTLDFFTDAVVGLGFSGIIFSASLTGFFRAAED